MRTTAVAYALLFVTVFRTSPVAGAAESELSFPSLNRAHRFSEVQAAPVAWGPFLLHCRVSQAELRLLSHRVFLTPLNDGTHRARIMARAEGNGQIVAQLSALGFATEQEDEVALPTQDQELTGRVRIARTGEAYRLTTVELPQHVTVRIRSRLGERLAGWCEDLPLLGTLGGDCEDIRRAVSTVTVQLPKPGETYEIRRDALTERERTSIDRYLRGRQLSH